jgi:hypothetical protein
VTSTQTAPTVESSPALRHLRDLVRAYAKDSRLRSIAVVGNAPLEPSAERAAAIDACDAVFRCNSFVLDRGDEAQQGRTVEVVVFNRGLRATPFSFDHYRDRLYLMVEPGRLHWEPDVRPDWWPSDLAIVNVPNREVTLPLSDALGLPSRTEPVWSTTGVMAAWMAVTLFPGSELKLAGFSMIDEPDQTHWEHAWGDSVVVGREHRIGPEGLLLEGWIKSGRATLLR